MKQKQESEVIATVSFGSHVLAQGVLVDQSGEAATLKVGNRLITGTRIPPMIKKDSDINGAV